MSSGSWERCCALGPFTRPPRRPVPRPTPAFDLEGRSAIDDVFGDASDYRRTLDRFLDLTASMQSMRDDFAKSVQSVLTEIGSRGPRPRARSPHGCPVDTVAQPYARHITSASSTCVSDGSSRATTSR